ncbi:MAG: NAD-dependent epimerase/dehydratase family protein [Thermodesulfobacteriota bacterium]
MKVLITGGAGFIGVNAAVYFSQRQAEVILFDNLSRSGTEVNAAWLMKNHPCRLIRGDIRSTDDIARAFRENGPFDLILHMAGQAAVTTSVADPRADFEINAWGTLNLLEAIRLLDPGAVLICASTNKVYGGMEDLRIGEEADRYAYLDLPEGIEETRPLDFHSPYGCSKGAADQYCRDYHRIYGLRTVVMRQSCIYGYHQFGIEDQGWVAWFCIAALMDRPITIYGSGKQVRDVLFVDDLVFLYDIAYRNIERTAGQVYNIGGGPEHTLSLRILLRKLEALKGGRIPVCYQDWRPGDQRVYVSNIRKAGAELGWKPTIPATEGVARLYDWIGKNRHLFDEQSPRRVLSAFGDGGEPLGSPQAHRSGGDC